MPTLLRDNPDEYPQSYVQAASLLHVWNAATLEWDLNSATDSVTVTGTVGVTPIVSTTATRTVVADNAASVKLLSANSARLQASIANDSSAALYVALGVAATTTNYTARVLQWGLYELPLSYTGEVYGIWAADPNDGAARITELT